MPIQLRDRTEAGRRLAAELAPYAGRSDVVVLPVRGRAPARQIVAAVRSGEDDPLVEHMLESLRLAAHKLAGRPALSVVA